MSENTEERMVEVTVDEANLLRILRSNVSIYDVQAYGREQFDRDAELGQSDGDWSVISTSKSEAESRFDDDLESFGFPENDFGVKGLIAEIMAQEYMERVESDFNGAPPDESDVSAFVMEVNLEEGWIEVKAEYDGKEYIVHENFETGVDADEEGWLDELYQVAVQGLLDEWEPIS